MTDIGGHNAVAIREAATILQEACGRVVLDIAPDGSGYYAISGQICDLFRIAGLEGIDLGAAIVERLGGKVDG